MCLDQPTSWLRRNVLPKQVILLWNEYIYPHVRTAHSILRCFFESRSAFSTIYGSHFNKENVFQKSSGRCWMWSAPRWVSMTLPRGAFFFMTLPLLYSVLQGNWVTLETAEFLPFTVWAPKKHLYLLTSRHLLPSLSVCAVCLQHVCACVS